MLYQEGGKALRIKTIVIPLRTPRIFDELVNDELRQGWELKSAYVEQTDVEPVLIAHLERWD